MAAQGGETSNKMLLQCFLRPLKLYRFRPEITMANVNLSGMTVEALMDLRRRVDETLNRRRAELEKQLAALGVSRVEGYA